MTYQTFESFDDLPQTGPALLHFAPFAELGCTVPTYWLPMMNRKVLCTRGIDQETGREVFIHMGVPYQDLAQCWLEEALAGVHPNRVFVSWLEIHSALQEGK